MSTDAPQAGTAAVPAGLARRFKAWRDATLSSPRFQRWASRFVLTRPVARRHAGALFDLCAGFVYSQVLFACVRLRLLEMLQPGPLTLAVIAQRTKLPTDSAARLVAAAAALDLLELRPPDRWGLGVLGAALLGNDAVLRMIEHHVLFYEDLRDPVALLRQPQKPGQLATYWRYARNPFAAQLQSGETGAYTDLMAATQALVAGDLLDAYPIAGHRCLLDVGGGDGSFLVAAAARAPHLQLMLFDLPSVAGQARVRLSAAGLAQRAQVFAGDFHADALPAGADVLTLVRVLHDHDDAAVRRLLRAAHRALPPGGQLVIAEPMNGVPGALPGTEAYFAFYLLAMGQGRARSSTELMQLLQEAGFIGVRLHPTARPWQCAVMSARVTDGSVRDT